MDIETAQATPRSPVSVAVTMRHHTLVQDKPQAAGGADEGPMASELLLAALLACQHSTFVKVAAKRRLDVRIAGLHAEMAFEGGDIARIAVRFDLACDAAVRDDALATMVRLTEAACTISKALKVPMQSTYTRVGTPAAAASSR